MTKDKESNGKLIAPGVEEVITNDEKPAILPTEPNKRIERDLYYKPMVAVRPETAEQFKNYTPPRFCYVLVEMPKVALRKNGGRTEKTLTYDFATLNMEHRPGALNKIAYLLNEKQGRIIDYGNIPKMNDEDPNRATLAKLHYNVQAKVSDYALLEKYIKREMNREEVQNREKLGLLDQLAAEQKEKRAMEKKLAELQAKQKGKEASKGAK